MQTLQLLKGNRCPGVLVIYEVLADSIAMYHSLTLAVLPLLMLLTHGASIQYAVSYARKDFTKVYHLEGTVPDSQVQNIIENMSAWSSNIYTATRTTYGYDVKVMNVQRLPSGVGKFDVMRHMQETVHRHIGG